jgi:uncharacterized membrane protein YhhN
VLAIVAAETGARRLYWLFKPLTMVWVIALALQGGATSPWLFAALLLSLLGDVALMWPARWFLVGLFAFLLAHIAYIVLFTQSQQLTWHWLAVPLIAFALLYWTLLARYKPRLMPAIVVYTAALLLMVFSGAQLAFARHSMMLLAGLLLFAFSDAVLGWNKFAYPIARAQTLILGSYFAAQTLIVMALL